MRILKLGIPAAAFAVGILLMTSSSFATMEISKKEKKACTVCHVKAGSKDLSAAGKYYKEKKTLEGYKPAK